MEVKGVAFVLLVVWCRKHWRFRPILKSRLGYCNRIVAFNSYFIHLGEGPLERLCVSSVRAIYVDIFLRVDVNQIIVIFSLLNTNL